MNLEDRKKIISNEYINMIYHYARDDKYMQRFANDLKNRIDVKYGVLYHKLIQDLLPIELENEYAYIPKLYGLLDINHEAMGVGKVQNVPQLGLMGEGVLLGIVDTGIDYTNPAFRNSDGTTRIELIWDQSIENLNASEDTFYYGTEYNKEQINNALKSEDPYSVVPSQDEIGHGTMMAGIAGGSRDDENNFQGVVPKSEFIIVKLKPAKKNIRDFFLIPESATCYQEDDIMFGIKYLQNSALKLKKPIVVCFGLGTSQGGHDAFGVLPDFIAFIGNRTGMAFIVAGGNEGSSKSHYYGEIKGNAGYDEVELVVGENEAGFTMELWGFPPNSYSVDILSPSGEYVPQIIGKLGESKKISFIFENTVIYVNNLLIESQTGSPLILFRLQNPSKGVWRFRVYVRGKGRLSFHIWLPISGFISPETYFNRSNPNTTITSPGNAFALTTVSAYNAASNNIYLNSSRGYSRDNFVKPDLAAPGVNVLAPLPGPGNRYSEFSGTSVAAAHTAGLAAMIFEWGIVRHNYETMGSLQIQRFLIRGADQNTSQVYPNNIWGYGKVNIYNTFLRLSTNLE